jgi:Calcineurin-like phosphoesterase
VKRLLAGLFGAALVTLTFSRVTAPSAQATDPIGNPVILAVGDMACDTSNANYNGGAGTGTNCTEQSVSTAMLNDPSGFDATLGLGDFQYDCSDPSDWAASYNPSYGRLDPWMNPVAGNHEYKNGTDAYGAPCPDNSAAKPYFDHFSSNGVDRAHAGTQGHYSFDLGSWHIVGLNANCSNKVGGCKGTSPQTIWLKNDLGSTKQPCIMAFWHQPLWTGTGTGVAAVYRTWWNTLYAAHADVVMNGHIHNYQRFSPMNPAGNSDLVNGITQYTVGSGGEAEVAVKAGVVPYPAAWAKTFGYSRMTLLTTGWTADFVRVDPTTGATTVIDTSTGNCHP